MGQGLGFLAKPEPSPDEVALVNGVPAAHLLSVYPIIAQELDAMEKALDNRMKMDLQHQRATPDQALRAWQEKAIYQRIKARIEQKIRAGGLTIPGGTHVY